MEQIHRDAIVICTYTLSMELDSLPQITAYMLSQQVFTSTNIEDIEAKATPYEKRKEFLQILQRRGAAAFDTFLDALIVASQQPHLAKMLLGVELYCRKQMEKKEIFKLVLNGEIQKLHLPKYEQLIAKHRFVEGVPFSIAQSLPEPSISFGRSMKPSNARLSFQNGPHAIPQIEATDINPLDTMDQPIQNLVVIPMDPNFAAECKPYRYPIIPPRKIIALVIINHFHGKGKNARTPGSNYDHSNLERLLHGLGCTIVWRENRSAAQMLADVKEFAALPDHVNCFAGLVFISSHGDGGRQGQKSAITGEDMVNVRVDELIAPLQGDTCKGLLGKPKAIFVQACRGDAQTTGIRLDGHDGIFDKMLCCVGSVDDVESPVFEEVILPDADIIMAFASGPGYISYNRPCQGTWFFYAICVTFAQHAKDKDVSQMLCMVNGYVHEHFASKPAGYKQLPRHTVSLRKLFYLCPGVNLSA